MKTSRLLHLGEAVEGAADRIPGPGGGEPGDQGDDADPARPDRDRLVPDMMADGKPKDIFVDDGLHMTPAGYAIWTRDIRRVFDWTEVKKLKCPSPERGPR